MQSPLLIYECYKPRTHEEAKEYINFVLSSRPTAANEAEELDPEAIDCESGEEPVRRPGETAGLNTFSPGSRLKAYLSGEKTAVDTRGII